MSELRPGYKRTDLGVIPEDWEAVSLAFASDKITDGEHSTPIRQADVYFLLSARNVLDGRLDTSDVDYVGTREFKRLRIRCDPLPGDILISCSGTIGRVARVPKDIECVLVRSVALVRPKTSRARSEYLGHWLRGECAQQQMEISVNQGAQPNLFLGQIKTLPCALPTLPEQRAIAEALGHADALVDTLEALIAKKRDIKQGAMQELLSGQRRLPGFAGEWHVKPFGDVLVKLNAKGNQLKTTEYQQVGGYPVVDQGKSMLVGYSDDEDRRFVCPEGGVIVFGDHTCIAKFVDFDFLVGADGTQIIRGREGQSTRFHAFQLQYRGIQPTGYNRHFKFLQERIFAVPRLDEQRAIAAVLSDMDAEIDALEDKLAKTRDVKQGMMQVLLTGEVRLV